MIDGHDTSGDFVVFTCKGDIRFADLIDLRDAGPDLLFFVLKFLCPRLLIICLFELVLARLKLVIFGIEIRIGGQGLGIDATIGTKAVVICLQMGLRPFPGFLAAPARP